jgi:transcription elongation factor GreA
VPHNQKPDPIPLTQQAYNKLRADLARLSKERKEVMERLKVAREMGDLSENGAYKYAKFEISSINRQLRDIHHQLDNGFVVASKDHYSSVEFGCQVTVRMGTTETTYMIVSKYESNPLDHKISLESPLGLAIAGKKPGDKVEFKTPKGVATYEIVSIA